MHAHPMLKVTSVVRGWVLEQGCICMWLQSQNKETEAAWNFESEVSLVCVVTACVSKDNDSKQGSTCKRYSPAPPSPSFPFLFPDLSWWGQLQPWLAWHLLRGPDRLSAYTSSLASEFQLWEIQVCTTVLGWIHLSFSTFVLFLFCFIVLPLILFFTFWGRV